MQALIVSSIRAREKASDESVRPCCIRSFDEEGAWTVQICFCFLVGMLQFDCGLVFARLIALKSSSSGQAYGEF